MRSQLVCRDAPIHKLFGERRIVYADRVASGRSLQRIEDFIAEHVPEPGTWSLLLVGLASILGYRFSCHR